MNQILYSGKVQKKPIFLVLIIILILIILFFTIGFGLINKTNKKILKGVVVANVDVSNMTKDEAIAAINEMYNKDAERTLVLNYEDYSATISSSDVGFGYTDAAKLVEEAYAYGRSGDLVENNFVVLKSYFNNEKRIETVEKIDDEKLEDIVKEMFSGEAVFAQDDEYEISGEKLLITKGAEGKKVNYAELSIKVLDAFKTKKTIVDIPVIISEPESLDIDILYANICKEPQNATYKEGQTFEIIKEENGIKFNKEEAKLKYIELKAGEMTEITLEVVEPEIKVADLGDVLFKNLISTYTSTYDATNKNRVTNLEVASERCNNTILYPGDEFSFNKALGHRTTANGYKKANSFAGGKVVQSVGGGICQVSSTLYNAALRADLTITDRTAHGMFVQYVPQSTDATVVDGAIDFKFRNDRKYPVKIVTTCSNGIVTASIYGFKDVDEPTIDVEVKILETIEYKTVKENDSSMKKGTTKVAQQPVNGYVSESYKVYYKDGKEVSRELISKDEYIPTNEIIKVGTKVDKPASTTPSGNGGTTPTTPSEPQTPIIMPPGWDNPESGY